MFSLEKCLPSRKSQKIVGERHGEQRWVSVLGRCLPYRELKKMTGEKQGPTIGVRFRKVFALLRAESKKITEEWQEATLARCPF